MCKHIYNHEIQYPKGTSFTYLIGWSKFDKFYYGVKFAKDCHPNDLWTTYFTSSTPLKEFRKLNGEPDIVKVDFVYDSGEEARLAEFEFIKKYNCVKDPKWFNLCNQGENFCFIECSDKTRLKMAKNKTGKIYINNGVEQKFVKKEDFETIYSHLQFVIGKLQKCNFSKSHRQTISNARKNKPLSTEHIRKRSETRLGSIYINNGVEQKLVKKEDAETIYYPQGWKKGKLNPKKHSIETRQRMSDSSKGKPKSIEAIQNMKKAQKDKIKSENHKKNISNARKDKIYINDGVFNKLTTLEDAETIYYPQGWKKGRLYKTK